MSPSEQHAADRCRSLPDPHGTLTPAGQRIEDAAELRAIARRLAVIKARPSSLDWWTLDTAHSAVLRAADRFDPPGGPGC